MRSLAQGLVGSWLPSHARSLLKMRRSFVCSSAEDHTLEQKVAIKKLSRPFQTADHAKRTYREILMLKHVDHENVSRFFAVFPLLHAR